MRKLALQLRPRDDADAESVSDQGEDFAGLYRAHQSLVRAVIYNIAGPEALDDLVQEAFLRIWRGLTQFRQESQIQSWIYRVSTNVALNHCRARKQRSSEIDRPDEEGADPAPGADTGLMNRDLVLKGLEALSEDHRAVLALVYLHDRSISEVSEILAISEGTVKSRLHHARENFRRFLEERGVRL